MSDDSEIGHSVTHFYDEEGWEADASGATRDAQLWEDLRPCAASYVSACRRKVLEFLPAKGGLLLDAASGPIQYPEYLEYGRNFDRRVCVDLSASALRQASRRAGMRALCSRSSVVQLPFRDATFDAVVSLHTIYHVPCDQQEQSVRELIRVTRQTGRVIVVYANPDRWLLAIKRVVTRRRAPSVLYYHAHPLNWWRRFDDECGVMMVAWRTLVAEESRRLVPCWSAPLLLNGLLIAERRLPALMTRAGAYPMIVLEKR